MRGEHAGIKASVVCSPSFTRFLVNCSTRGTRRSIMLYKYLAILLSLSAVVVLAGKKDKDDYQRSGGCPCADAFRSDSDDCCSGGRKVSPCSGFERVDDCPFKERKAYEKLMERKFKSRKVYEDDDDDFYSPEEVRQPRFGYRDFPEDDDFVMRGDSKFRKQKRDKKYKRDQYDAEDEFDSDVSPQCMRYVNDIPRLIKCERKVAEKITKEPRKTSEGVTADYPAVCQQFANDPYKLHKCIRKSSFWAEFVQHPTQFSSEAVHPECQVWAHDPYKLQKCEYKLRKFEGDNMKKSSKGFY